MKTVINNEGSGQIRILQTHFVLIPGTYGRYRITIIILNWHLRWQSKENNRN